MLTGIVIGEIYSTINHPFYDRKKILMVEKTDFSGRLSGDYIIAVDNSMAGMGDRVLVLDEGNGARQVFSDPEAPVRSAIIGIIDKIETG